MENLKQKYEIIMIFSVANGDDNAKVLAEKFNKMIEENATDIKVEEWGKRKLAYLIEDEPDGYYLLVNFTSERTFPTELERVLRITDGVLRSMVVRVDEVIEAV